jgi:hypothetical protein
MSEMNGVQIKLVIQTDDEPHDALGKLMAVLRDYPHPITAQIGWWEYWPAESDA